MKKDLPKRSMGPPDISEYSKEAAGKSIAKATLTHPVTVYATAVGLLGSLYFGILGPSFYAAAAAISGISLGLGTWVVNYFFRYDSFGQRYFGQLDEQREQYKNWLIEQVKDGLSFEYATKEAISHARQGCEQFERARVVRDGIQELLLMKLNTNELTSHRFLAAAEQAYLSMLDNLKDVVAALKSANPIDPNDLRHRISASEKSNQLSAADQEEKETLKERLQLWIEQMERVDGLLAKNEKVITSMECISARVAEWNTDQHFASGDVESIISELHELAQYAHNLNHSQ